MLRKLGTITLFLAAPALAHAQTDVTATGYITETLCGA